MFVDFGVWLCLIYLTLVLVCTLLSSWQQPGTRRETYIVVCIIPLTKLKKVPLTKIRISIYFVYETNVCVILERCWTSSACYNEGSNAQNP